MKYLPPVKPKLFPKLKILRFTEIWQIRHFKCADLDFDVENDFH